MKKTLSLLTILMLFSMSFVLATGPVQQIPLIGDGQTPMYEEADFSPLVFLNQNTGGRVVNNEAPWVLPGDNGNIKLRDNNYAFTGEQIQWKVLVWDKNGVPEKINDVFAGWADQTNGPVDPEIQVNCNLDNSGLYENANLAAAGYPNVRRPGDQEPQTTFNPDTMGQYVCTLTIEPTCHGQKWVGVKAVDVDGNSGTMQEAESWFCNPTLDLFVSGSANFGALSPGEQGSSTFSVENMGEQGSGVEVVLAIAGTDFYDPESSGARCPSTNQLELQGDQLGYTYGFWYTAVMGSNSAGPKRIPYEISGPVSGADPIFSSSSQPQWRKWSQSELVPMSPGSEATLTLHLGLPQPCNGQFTDGNIDLFAWAI